MYICRRSLDFFFQKQTHRHVIIFKWAALCRDNWRTMTKRHVSRARIYEHRVKKELSRGGWEKKDTKRYGAIRASWVYSMYIYIKSRGAWDFDISLQCEIDVTREKRESRRLYARLYTIWSFYFERSVAKVCARSQRVSWESGCTRDTYTHTLTHVELSEREKETCWKSLSARWVSRLDETYAYIAVARHARSNECKWERERDR